MINDAPQWQGRPILNKDDVHDLESRAASLEFQHRLRRDDAEHRAYHEYRRDKHREGAAYHLQGMKLAQGSGNQEDARRHSLLYGLHLQKLGLNPVGPVPPDIKSMADKQDRLYAFKPHRGDSFLLDGD